MKHLVKQLILVLVVIFVLGGITSAFAANVFEEAYRDLPEGPELCKMTNNELSKRGKYVSVESCEEFLDDEEGFIMSATLAATSCCADSLYKMETEHIVKKANRGILSYLAQCKRDGYQQLIGVVKSKCGHNSETVKILEKAVK